MHCEIDVWLIDLSDGAAPAHGDMALLSPAERQRFDAFLSPKAACEFASTRIALRRILGLQLGLAPARVALSAQGGKPFVEGMPRCRFNVTHASSLAAIAVHESIEVGIDIEHPSSFGDIAVLSQMICSPFERTWLQASAGTAPSVELLARLWTGKEAALKATGRGLAIPADQVDLSETAAAGGGQVVLAEHHARQSCLPLRWQALTLHAGWHGAVAAVAPSDCDGLVPRYRTLLSTA